MPDREEQQSQAEQELQDVEAQVALKKFIEKDAGDGTNRFDQQEHGAALVISLLSCSIALFLIALDQTIIFTILVKVGNKWGQYDKVAWIATGYMLTMAMFVQIWGKCSIFFGRKPSLLSAICIFEIGSLVAAVSPSMDALIVGRVIAGIGGGGIQVLVFIVVSEMVPISKRSLIFALMGVIFSVSSIIGPLMGGAFTDNVSWRWCFYINLPLGGFAFCALFFFFHPPSPIFTWRERFQQIDYIGSFLMVSGIVLSLVALSVGGTELPWNSGGVISMFIIGGLLCISFCVWNFKYSKKQVIPSAIAKSIHVLAPCFQLFLVFLTFMGTSIFFTTYLQVVRGYDAIKAGIHFFPMVIALVISSISTGILVRKIRFIQPFAILSGLFGCVGAGLMTMFTVDAPKSYVLGLMILPGVSIGIAMQATMIGAQVSAPKETGGMIMTTTFTNFSRALGGAVGSSLAQVIYNSSVRDKLVAAYSANQEAFEGISMATLETAIGSPDVIKTLSPEVQFIVLTCVMDAIRNVYYFCLGVSCFTFFVPFFYSSKRLPKDEDVEKRSDYKHDGDENLQQDEPQAEKNPELDEQQSQNSEPSCHTNSTEEGTVAHHGTTNKCYTQHAKS